jgi:predicted Rossmann fold nucleotide-binding protein DprA/Smf involved in DNA uptake
VPGPFDSPASAGCHAFLRSFPGQARVVCGVAELIEDLELKGGVDAGVGETAINPIFGAPADLPGARTRPGAVASGNSPSSSARGAGRAAVLASLGPVERALAEQLARGPATADQLALRTSLAGAAVLSALTLLELRGLAIGAYGRYSPSGPLASWSGSPPKGRST